MRFDFSDENAKWLIILLVFMIVLFIGNIFSNIQQIGISIDYDNGEYIKQSRANGADFLHKILFYATGGIYIAVIALFSVWIYGIVARVAKFNLSYFFISPGKALASIFIPGLNLFRPIEYCKEVYKAITPMSSKDPKKAWIYNKSTSLPELVWIGFIVGTVISFYGSLTAGSSYYLDDFIFMKLITIVGFIFILTGSVLLIKLVLKISNNLDLKEEELDVYNSVVLAPEPIPAPAE